MHRLLILLTSIAALTLQSSIALSASIRFSGSVDTVHDRITIPVGGSQSANIGATDFTIEIWLRPDATQNNGNGSAWWQGNIFIDRDILGNIERAFGASLRGGRVTFTTRPAGGSQTLFTASSDVRDDQWHWIVITYERSTGDVQIYVDGTREAASSGSPGDLSFLTSSNTKDRLIELGGEKHFQGTPSYVGFMSEIRFSNIIRYSAGSISVPTSELAVDSNTVAYWGFSGAAGNVLTDASVGNNHGSIEFGGSPQVPVWSVESPYGGTSTGTLQFGEAAYDVSEAQTQVLLPVIRSGGSSGVASVDALTAAGTATAGADYQTSITQLTWANGELGAKDVSVTLIPDSQPEADETFSLDLANAIGSSLGATRMATVTILDDDSGASSGTIQFSQSAYNALEDSGVASISVTRQGGSNGPVSANFSTADETAIAGADYEAASGTISYGDGETDTRSIQVVLLDDNFDEPNETLQLNMSGASLGMPSMAVLTIIDDDTTAPQPGTIQFSRNAYSAVESSSNTQITVTRVGGSDGLLSANYATTDGTAMAGSDYSPSSGTVSFADGDSISQTVSVSIIEDSIVENDETLQITLNGPSLGSPASATVTIVDNDNPPVAKSSGGGAVSFPTLLSIFSIALIVGTRRRRTIARRVAYIYQV